MFRVNKPTFKKEIRCRKIRKMNNYDKGYFVTLISCNCECENRNIRPQGQMHLESCPISVSVKTETLDLKDERNLSSCPISVSVKKETLDLKDESAF